MLRLLKPLAILVLLAGLASCNSSGPAAPNSESPPTEALGIPGIEFSMSSIAIPSDGNRREFMIANVGSADMNWKIKSVTAPWVTVSPTAGNLRPGNSAAVTVTVDRDDLTPGNHSAAIAISSGTRLAVLTVRVSDAPPSSGSVTLEPASLTLGPSASTGEVQVVNKGSAPIDWTMTGPSWATISPASGRLNAGTRTRVVVTPDRSRLTQGRHTQALSLTSNRGSASATLSVDVAPPTSSSPPELRLEPSTLDFSTAKTQLTFEVVNDGGQPLDWSVTGPEWVTTYPTSGRVAPGARQAVVAIPDRSKLSVGRHSGALSIASNGGSGTVTVAIYVITVASPTRPRLRLEPAILDFGTRTTPLSVSVINDSDSELEWTAEPLQSWISITPNKGKVPARGRVAVQVSRAGLTSGSAEGEIRFVSNAGWATVLVRATTTEGAKLRVSPGSIDFGMTNTELTVRVHNDGDAALQWSAQPSWGWISASPSSANLAPGSSTAVTVRVARQGLSGGEHEGTVRFTSKAGSATVTARVGVVSPPKLRVSQTALNFGTSTNSLTFKVFNDGGQGLAWTAQSNAGWLTASPTSGTVPAGSSQEVRVQASRTSLAPAADYATSIQIGSNGGSASIAANLKTVSTPPPPPVSGEVNVRDYGAVGDGVHDDVPAFQAALRAIRSSGGGGVLRVPAGVYLLKPYGMGALEIYGATNLTIAGDGMEQSILRIAPGSYTRATFVMLFGGASGVTIRDLAFDGNEPNATFTDEQSHAVEIRNSADMRFERVLFKRMHGDAIHLIGYAQDKTIWTERIVITNSRFEDVGRCGVGIQRAVRDVKILNNTFERVDDQSISSEPTGRALGGDLAPQDILMEGNTIRHSSRNVAVSLEGFSTSNVIKGMIFRNNTVVNGGVEFRRTDGLLVEGNTITGDQRHSALRLSTKVTNAIVADNDVTSQRRSTDGAVEVVAEYDATNAFPSRITIQNNRIRVPFGSTGILVRDALGDIQILGNEVDGQNGSSGIFVMTEVTKGWTRTGYVVRDNAIRGFQRGVHFDRGGDPFREVSITANTIDHSREPRTDAVGILFSKTGPYASFATVADNQFGPGIKTQVRVSTD